jgi:hypothetical protein
VVKNFNIVFQAYKNRFPYEIIAEETIIKRRSNREHAKQQEANQPGRNEQQAKEKVASLFVR